MQNLYIPTILPDELATSYAMHVASANGLSHRELLARIRRSNEHLVQPKKLQLLAELLGRSTHEIVCQHTVIPFYDAFESGTLARLPHGMNKRNLNPTSGIFHINHEDKFCALCAKEDVSFWGRSYWRRSHQTPGMCWCSKHQTPLHVPRANCATSFFPDELIDISVPCISEPFPANSSVTSRYLKLVDFILDLKRPTSLSRMKATLRDCLQKQNYARRPSEYRDHLPISDKVIQACSHKWIKKMYFNPTERYPQRNFSKMDSIDAPSDVRTVTYLLMLAVLFANPDDAANKIVGVQRSSAECASEIMGTRTRESNNEAARSLLLDVCTAHG